MADDIKIKNFPDGGSEVRVAHDLYKELVGLLPEENIQGVERIDKRLRLFEICYTVTRGGYVNTDKIT